MTQINMLEAKTDLSALVKRNGKAVVQMTLIPKKQTQKRIGVAEGKFEIPDEFDAWDKGIEEMFGRE